MEKKISFEEGMAHLEEIVKALEEGALPLEECFHAYERGMKLVNSLGKMLDDGEARIRALTDDGEIPFEAEVNP